MFKKYLCAGFLLLLFITPIYANNIIDEQFLKDHYGERLKGASIDIKYAFKRQLGKSWDQTSYNERKKFLNAWEKRVQLEAAEANRIQKEKEEKNRELERVRVENERIKKDKIRAEESQAREERQRKNESKRNRAKKAADMQKSFDRLRSLDRRSGQ